MSSSSRLLLILIFYLSLYLHCFLEGFCLFDGFYSFYLCSNSSYWHCVFCLLFCLSTSSQATLVECLFCNIVFLLLFVCQSTLWTWFLKLWHKYHHYIINLTCFQLGSEQVGDLMSDSSSTFSAITLFFAVLYMKSIVRNLLLWFGSLYQTDSPQSHKGHATRLQWHVSTLLISWWGWWQSLYVFQASGHKVKYRLSEPGYIETHLVSLMTFQGGTQMSAWKEKSEDPFVIRSVNQKRLDNVWCQFIQQVQRYLIRCLSCWWYTRKKVTFILCLYKTYSD